MLPTCSLNSKDCPPHWHPGVCGACGSYKSWHRGGTLDVYKGQPPEILQKRVMDGFFK